MQTHELRAFTGLVTDALAYYRQPVSEFTLQVWLQACRDYTLEQVKKAMTAHATDPDRGQYAPKVADIVRILAGTTTDRAALAWGKTFEAMQAVGAYTDVVFDDPAIHAVVEDLGGWPKICRSQLDDLSHLQHRFCVAYKAYVGRGQFEYQRKLMGDRSPDSMYEKRGLPLPRPAIVGNKEAARLVYEGGNSGGKTQISFTAFEAVRRIAA